MAWKTILIKNNGYVYEGNGYLYGEEPNNFYKEARKRKFIVLEQDVFSTEITGRNESSIKKSVKEEVAATFSGEYDYLFHYEKIKKGKWRLYALKGGRKLESLCKKVNKILVKPIQWEILKYIKKNIKKSDYGFICSVNGGYYYLKIRDKRLYKSICGENLEDLFVKINILIEEEEVYITTNCLIEIDSINVKEKKYVEFENKKWGDKLAKVLSS